jgi:predicted DNA-binding protein (MmcQ/YjbR family)
MNIEVFRDYCLHKKAVSEGFPFDEQSLVFKVGSKMFALCSLDSVPFSANLKCDPEKAISLREQYENIQPGYHMSKKHWNTVVIDGSLSDDFICELIDHSYDLVVKGMTKKQRKEYGL